MCQTNRILVKGMVCQRCIAVVRKELDQLRLPPAEVSLGQVDFAQPLSHGQFLLVSETLREYGFDVVDDRQSKIVNEVKALVAELFSSQVDLSDIRISKYISTKLYRDYDSISSTFSACQGITLEKYFIQARIDKVKELLLYTNNSISDIAYDLGYSSVAHLSKQFKQVTGLNLSAFREMHAALPSAAA